MGKNIAQKIPFSMIMKIEVFNVWYEKKVREELHVLIEGIYHFLGSKC